jgi:glycosyltransferase involved in cell wall biosynthesis
MSWKSINGQNFGIPFCTFIVPTIGRDTLKRTLQSLADQTDPDWNAVVVADCVENFALPLAHDRILSVNLAARVGSANHGAKVRNHAMSLASGDWLVFVDDDDRLDARYVEWLRLEYTDADVVVFRMTTGSGAIPSSDNLDPGGVGISFAIRAEFQREKGLVFSPDPLEDWWFLDAALRAGSRRRVSEKVAYYIRH